MTAGFIVGPGDGRKIPLGPFAMEVKADAAATQGTFTLLEASEPPGFGPPLHIHHDAAEAFYVLEGAYRIVIEGRETLCQAGSFVYIPAGIEHGFRVGDRPSRKLNLYLPAAMLGYFDALSAAIEGGDVTDTELAAIAERANMTILGEIPDEYV